MKVAKIFALVGLFLVGVGVLVACTTPEQVELAEMQKLDAAARLASAQADGTVKVLAEQTNSYVRSSAADVDNWERRMLFERDMFALTVADHIQAMENLELALKTNQGLVNAEAAASNSFWSLIVMPICAGVILLCLSGLMIYSNAQLNGRMIELEKKMGAKTPVITTGLRPLGEK